MEEIDKLLKELNKAKEPVRDSEVKKYIESLLEKTR